MGNANVYSSQQSRLKDITTTQFRGCRMMLAWLSELEIPFVSEPLIGTKNFRENDHCCKTYVAKTH